MIWIKAQTSFEIIFSISIALIIIAFLLQFMLSRQKDKDDIEDFMENQLACGKFINEVQSVFILGNGTKSTIKISRDLNVSHGAVISGSVLCRACCNVTMNGSQIFNITSGFITIQNNNGDISV